MTTYLVLLNFTEQGLRQLNHSPARAAEFKQQAEAAGCDVAAQLWTAGAFDGALLLRGPSETAILRLLAHLTAQGNVRTQSLRAFEGPEFSALLH
jgi:uncharacterized protein with GYD domain